MRLDANMRYGRDGERGSALTLAAISLVVVLGMAGLAIDLAALYVARSEAQRAADAAALAGAHVFATSGCLSSGGCVAGGAQESPARQTAEAVGGQNGVAGQLANIVDGDVTFTYPNPEDPEITVVVQRTDARSNAVPVFFMKIFGVQTADISAKATAEASAGGSINCAKPWILPNCDPSHSVGVKGGSGPGPCAKSLTTCVPAALRGNVNCPIKDPVTGLITGFSDYFVQPPPCPANPNGCLVNPGPAPGGVIGENISLKPGQPADAPTASKFYPIFIPGGFTASSCPLCASTGVTPSTGAAWYEENIECCNSSFLKGGPGQVIQPTTGNQQGPTAQGVMCLIHQIKNTNPTTGQDTYPDPCAGSPATPYGVGSNNPLVVAGTIKTGTCVSTSDSVVTIPLYDGSSLCPGQQKCPTTDTVNIQGFLQVFIQQVTPAGQNQGNVTANVLNLIPGNAPPVTAGGTPIAVRLIHN